jgi:putative nucleotidyltransferase with HDIG domain
MTEEFDKYVNNYDLDNLDILLKYNHSYRVMNLQEKYARLLGWNEEDVELARIIGLLHDIGRFEQLKVYNTYNDLKSIDHADYSVEQLFEKNEIVRFCNKEEWYPIISFAIKNHNKHHIEDCDDDRMLKHARLIRDTDKLDILYIFGTLHEIKMKINDSVIHDEVKDSIKNHTTADRKYIITDNDHYASKIAFAFDIYNDVALYEYKEYLESFIEPLKDNKELYEIYKDVIKYIDERLDNYERTRKEI